MVARSCRGSRDAKKVVVADSSGSAGGGLPWDLKAKLSSYSDLYSNKVPQGGVMPGRETDIPRGREGTLDTWKPLGEET